jgi:16S rRNA processing protein RimM
LLIHENDAKVLPEDTFYIHDLVEMDVYRTDETYLGKVKEIISTGSNDVYVVKGQGQEVLIPALKAIITIDITQRKIVVSDLPGLFDNPEEA